MIGNATVRGAALVTGAGQRLGLAVARDLAARGWAVAFHANASLDAARRAAREVRDAGGRAVALGADLADPSSAPALVAAAVEALGPVTLLVNNAAVFVHDTVRNATPGTVAANLDVNLVSPIMLTQAFASRLPVGMDGNVINILDQRVVNPRPGYMSYAASKNALALLTRTWALELAPSVRVNAVGPGIALPDPDDKDASAMDRMTGGYPLRRGTTPEEICDALAFLLRAPAITGEILYLDGGQRLGWLHPDGGYPLVSDGR